MKKIIKYWNQNRLKIIIILIIIVFAFILIKATNILLFQRETVKENQNLIMVNYTGPTESVITGEKVTEDQTQMFSTLNQFIDYCNNQKIDEAYELLSDECKENLYPSVDTFKNSYYNQIFAGKKKNVNIDNWVGNIYKVEIKEDALSTGIYNETSQIQDYITIVTDDNGEYKLNVNSYIGKTEINKTSNYEDIQITVLRSDSYMDYQTFTFKIINNSDNEILLDDKLDSNSMYIEDQNKTRYTAYTHEISDAELSIGAKQTREITIKYYNKYGSTKNIEKIVFSRIILNNNVNESRKYGDIQIEI